MSGMVCEVGTCDPCGPRLGCRRGGDIREGRPVEAAVNAADFTWFAGEAGLLAHGGARGFSRITAGTRLAPEAAGTARATIHGGERLIEAGFTDDLVTLTRTEGISFAQADGAQVFLREVSPGRFDFIVQGQRGVITAHRGWSTKNVERLARNYGWDWP